MNDHISPAERIYRLESNMILDWFETWHLRWEHYRAQTEADWHRSNIVYHHELAQQYTERAQFWRNRQIERGKDVSYDYRDITCWVDWACAIGIGLAVILMIAVAALIWVMR